MAATTKTVYIGSTQVAPEILNSDVVTNGVYRNLSEIDWGDAPTEFYEQARPFLDGVILRGSHVGPRDFMWKLISRVNVPTVSNVEAVRDDELEQLLDYLSPDRGVLTLKQSRVDAAGGAISRVIYAAPKALPAWKWSPHDIDDGFVGSHEGNFLVLPIAWRAHFPWFIDEADSNGTDMTINGTTMDTDSITNNGIIGCGLRISITGSGTGDVTIANTTSGESITLNNIVLHASNAHVVDYHVADPLNRDAYRSSTPTTKIWNTISAGGFLGLDRGANTITVVSEAGVSGTVTFRYRQFWGAP